MYYITFDDFYLNILETIIKTVSRQIKYKLKCWL